jgi:hypothetical protein
VNYDPPNDGFSPQHDFGSTDVPPPAAPRAPIRSLRPGDVITEARATWQNHGPHLLKGFMPVLALVGGATVVTGILRAIIAWLGIPFIGSLIQLLSFGVGIVSLALFFGMMAPMRAVLEGGAGTVAPADFLKRALEDIVALSIFSLAAMVGMTMGGCFMLLPGLVVAAIAYPMGFIIATEDYGIGDALPEAVEILKANIAPLAVIVGIMFGASIAVVLPVVGLAAAVSFIGGPIVGQLMTSMLMAVLMPALLFALWLVVGSTMVKIREPEPAKPAAW